MTQTAKGYGDNRWATYKQIKDMGGQVRKGDKATHVLFYKFDDETPKAQDQPDRPTTEGKAEREHTRPPMVRCYAVFNVAQADGLKLERKGDDREHEPEWKAHQTAERVIQESGIHVAHVRGDRTFYNLQSDTVTLPEREQFATANGYYQTALHELGHATGHPERMDRETLTHGAGYFGSVECAREELRAEMSAMMTGERVGVGHDGSRGAAYVQGWLKALEQDPKEMYKAAADAQKNRVYPGFPTLFWGLSVFFVGDLMGKALWKLVENAARFPRRGGRVLCVHGAVSFHKARPCGPRWLPGRGAMRHVELDRRVLGLQSTDE